MSDPASERASRPIVPPPLIELWGLPRERGRLYGECARERIRRGIDHYRRQLEAAALGWPELAGIVARYEPTLLAFEPAYVEEMKGIAEGAGVEYAAVVLLNARTELLKLAERRRKGLDSALEPDGCTGVVVLPERSANGTLIHAQNWDWKVECADTAVVLRVKRDDGGPDLLVFTEAGALARAGFNAAGIAITGNYLESDRDYRRTGVPLALVRRKALEQRQLALTMRVVHGTLKSASNNVIVSHAGGVALDFECAPDETFVVPAERGLIVHANHWQSAVALTRLKDTGIANTPDSLYRDLRVRQLLETPARPLAVADVKASLFDDFETPWAVCRPPRLNTSNNLSASVAMIVMEPARGRMEVAMLPALNREFASYMLEMENR